MGDGPHVWEGGDNRALEVRGATHGTPVGLGGVHTHVELAIQAPNNIPNCGCSNAFLFGRRSPTDGDSWQRVEWDVGVRQEALWWSVYISVKCS